MKRTLFLFAAPLFALSMIILPSTYAQQKEDHGAIGLSCAIQHDQLDIMIPVALVRSLSLVPSFGVASLTDVGTDLHVGVAVRHYLSDATAAPFIGARATYLMFSPKSGVTTKDWLFGGLAGGEYFFDPHFSVGIEAQLNYAVSDKQSSRFGNPGKGNLNTATALFATIYF